VKCPKSLALFPDLKNVLIGGSSPIEPGDGNPVLGDLPQPVGRYSPTQQRHKHSSQPKRISHFGKQRALGMAEE
jgi:hypothetical protein